MSQVADLAIIGGGIVGCATALAISSRHPDLKIVLFEKEQRLATHQTGHNSGVIHSGLYYKPGSLKAKTCSAGREALYRFCAEHGVKHERCGKIVVAVDESQRPALQELERRGKANGLDGLQPLTADEIKKHEPHVQGVAGLFVPQTGIVDFVSVTEKLAELFRARGGQICLNAQVKKIEKQHNDYLLHVGRETFAVGALVNCSGLYSDMVACQAGLQPTLKIVPFRGEYYQFKPERYHLVNNLVYPVPDPQMPFLGVHFTRMVDGTVEAGPNAVLAWRREGYHRFDLSLSELTGTLSFKGFWKLSARFWRQGLEEYGRSFSKPLFVKNLQRLIPDISADDLIPGHSGVRAQAVGQDGQLIDDFCILTEARMVHVLNAPSPAATASLSIGEYIADQVDAII